MAKRRSRGRSAAQVAAQKKAAKASAAKRKGRESLSTLTKRSQSTPNTKGPKRALTVKQKTDDAKHPNPFHAPSTKSVAKRIGMNEKALKSLVKRESSSFGAWEKSVLDKSKKATRGKKVKKKLTPSQKHGSGTGLSSAFRYTPTAVKKRGG